MSRARDGNGHSPTRSFGIGLCSGVATTLILQPIDVLKTRIQQQSAAPLHTAVHKIWNPPATTPSSFTTKGLSVVSGFWRGTWPSVLRTGFGSAIYFTSLDMIRQSNVRETPGAIMLGRQLRPSRFVDLFGGASARLLAGFLTMPLTILKVRFESDSYTYRAMTPAIRSMYAHGGISIFFKGFGATALRDAPYAGLYVLSYEFIKDSLHHTDLQQKSIGRRSHLDALSNQSPIVLNLVSALLAGAMCSIVTNPLDVIKTRIQLHPQLYKDMLITTRLVVQAEGLRAFFSGATLRMARKGLSSALAWTFYEEIKRYTLQSHQSPNLN
jgi:solute carrier family 25 protein 38